MKRFILSLFLVTALIVPLSLPLTSQAADQICFLGFCYYPDAGSRNSGWDSPDNPVTFGKSQNQNYNGSDNRKADLRTGQGIIVALGAFLNGTLVPFLFAIALLFFLINTVRYFIIGSSDPEKQSKARQLALYGIGAFVFLVSIWGIVNMFVSGLNLKNTDVICPDYLGDWCDDRTNSNTNW